jgi:hypothetical protein
LPPALPEDLRMTKQPAPRRGKTPKRMAAMALSLLLLLPACQTPGGVGGAALSPQQQALRDQSDRWNMTVGTGALVGAGAGAGIGAAAAGRNNRAAGAVIGGLVGLIGGAVAGTAIANRNLAFENRELSASQRIESAEQIAQNLNNAASTAEQVTQENRRKLAQLDQQFRGGQITAAQYRDASASMRQDAELMKRTSGEAREARERLVASARTQPQLMSQEAKIDSAQRRLEVSASDLEDALRRVPTT